MAFWSFFVPSFFRVPSGFISGKMSRSFQSPFSTNDLKEEKIETAGAAEEFRVSEYQAGPLHGSTFPFSTNSNSNWNSCLKTEENPDTGDSESIPIYATSFLDPSFMEHQGTRVNGVKAEEDSYSHYFLEEGENSNETAETRLKDFSSSNSGQQKHLRAHGRGSVFECPNCPRHFKFPSQLKYHIQYVHSDERPFKCKVCSSSFKTSSCLQKHIRTHSDERPFKCKACSSSFKTSRVLREHLRTHSDERQFRCGICSADFKTSGCLRDHRRRTHTDERHFKCELCPFSFKCSGHLKQHRRTHNDEQKQLKQNSPWWVTVQMWNLLTVLGFKTSCHLKERRRTHSDERPFKCKICSASFKTSRYFWSNIAELAMMNNGSNMWKLLGWLQVSFPFEPASQNS